MFCGMEWAIEPEDVIEEFSSQRHTVLHVDTSASGCLIHDEMAEAPADDVFAHTDSYRQYCGQ